MPSQGRNEIGGTLLLRARLRHGSPKTRRERYPSYPLSTYFYPHKELQLYEPNVLIDGYFKVPPRIQFNRGTHYTGRIVCAAPFCKALLPFATD